METIIDLQAERNARERPAPEFIRFDDHGRTLGCFALDYQMDGAAWSINVWAYSFDDADMRVAAMRETLTLAGQIHEVVPA